MKNNLLIFDKNTCGKCNKIIYLVQLIMYVLIYDGLQIYNIHLY